MREPTLILNRSTKLAMEALNQYEQVIDDVADQFQSQRLAVNSQR